MKKTNFNLKSIVQKSARWLLTLIALLTLGTGQMWADDKGFYEVYMVYDKNGTEYNYTYNGSNGSMDLGTISSTFKIKKMYLKVWDNWGDQAFEAGSSGLGYKTQSGSDTDYKANNRTSKSGNNYELQHTNMDLTIASNTNPSGNYTFTHWWFADGTWTDTYYLKNGSSNCAFTYKILPPAVKSNTISISATNTAPGSGTGLSSSSPIILISGMASKLTITATQNHTDANSALWCKFGNGSYSATTTYDIASGTSQSNQTLALAVKYRNNSASLDGTETTATIYYKWAAPAPAITLTSVTPSSSIVVGNDITLVGTRVNSSNAISFQYTTNDGSTWTDITPKTSSLSSNTLTVTWTVPEAHGATQTYKFRAKLAESTPIYSSASDAVSVYGKKTIHVKNTNNWGTLYLYAWDSEDNKLNGNWPGKTGAGSNGLSCTKTGGQWWDVVITSQVSGFVLNANVSGDANQTADLSYSTYTDDRCLAIGTGSGKKTLANTAVTCPSAPDVTTAAAGSFTNIKATLNASGVAANNDAITAYGFKWDTTTACANTQAASNLSSTTFSYQLTGLTAGQTYFFKAYATNGQGTTYGEVKSFTVPYKVTITKPTGCSAMTPGTSTQYVKVGDAITATAATGYQFSSWTVSNLTLSTPSTTSGVTTSTITAISSDNGTITAVYNPITYSNLTLEKTTGSADGKYSVTYNATSLTVTTAPTKTGYSVEGYYKTYSSSTWTTKVATANGTLQASTGYTDADKKWTSTASPTLYTKWQADTYSITLHDNNGGSHNGTATATYDSNKLTSITAPTRTGYHLVDGYYRESEKTNKISDLSGNLQASTAYTTSGKLWNSTSGQTLYAKWAANTYTIAFNANDAQYVGTATGTTASIAATYGQSYALTANGFTREGYTFAGWATSAKGAVTYTDGQTVSNLTSTNGGTKTLYAKWTPKTYTVTFNARGGSGLTPTSKTVTMGATYGTLATVTPPAGKVFSGWYTSAAGGTLVESSTQVTTASDHTLYAHYAEKAQVYFKNTIGWSQVWVTYDANWDGTQGTGNQGKTYHRMNLVPGTTDVYYDDIPDEYLTSWRWNIAFNNLDYSSTPFYAFDNGEAVFRYDFDKNATMFVPTSNTGTSADGNYTKNGVQYRSTGYSEESSGPKYTSGYWRTYNDTYSGYTLTYQKKGGSWSGGHKMESAKVGDNVFCFTVNMEANSQYNFSFYKNYNLNNKSKQFCYNPSTQINSSNCTNLQLDCNPQNSYMQTTVAGEYTFQLEMKADGHMYLSVIYPLAVGDFRVRYNYTKGSAKTYYSEIIKGRANGKDTISIFIHSKDSASSRSLTVEKCTGISSGTPTWNTSYRNVTSKLPAATTAGGKTSGVYDFIITQNGSKEIILDNFSYWKQYTGNYYIRTQCADGGWDFYRERSDNLMTLSEYSLTQTLSAPYSHYYCRFISDSEISTTDISYAVATDYSPNISGTMVGDATIGGDAVKVLPASANVRFSWNEETNAMRRAYLKNAQTENARFLVLHGSDSKVLSATGSTISAKDDLQDNELKFTDMGNWIYQVNLQAQPGAEVSLIANYNGADRYLIGGATSFLTIIDGEGSAKYEMIAVYDFKTNRLMIAWTPSGEVGQNLTDVDVLLVRYKQNAGTVITLGTGKSVTSKTVIGAIRFDYNDLVGHVADWNSNSRPLLKYFISFPFDVNVSDIFGLNSAYGDAYEIQMYDGAERARKGFFRGDGTTTFWKTLQPGDVMKANEGYCVIMDNDYLNNDIGHVWDNKVAGSSVYLYFPSTGPVGSIASSSKTIAIPMQTCSIDRPFVSTQAGGRTVSHQNTDSHWNMMGIPIFANTTDGTLGGAFVTSGQDGDGTFKYFYAWNSSNNQFAINTASGYTFNSMHGYMVQYYGDVTFTGAHTNIPASVARRAPEENHQIELQVLNSDEEVINRAYVELRENACDTFALNEDVYMWTTNEAVDIYTFAGNYDVSANVLSLNDQTIQVGVEVRKAGKYTFSMPSNFNGTATLIDTFTGTRTNLAVSDYEVQLEKGIDTERFLLELYIEKVTTSLENNGGNNMLKDGGVHKFIKDNQLYILKNGVIYDARGARVQ